MLAAPVTTALVMGIFEKWFRSQAGFGNERAGRGAGPDAREQQEFSLLTESFVYVGTLLVLAGSTIAVDQRWLHITNTERVVILAAAALVLVIAGFVLRWVTSSRVHRATEVLWLASTASAAGAAAIAAARVYGQAVSVTVLAVSASFAVYSFILWLLCRRELLMVTSFAGLIGALCGGITIVASDSAPWLTIALGLWLFGVAWTVLGWLYPQPLGTSVAVGATIALVTPAIAVHDFAWVYALGIATAAAVMAASLPMRNAILLAFGSCAEFGYITLMVLRYANGALGIAETLMLIGGILIGLALVTVHLGRATGRRMTGREVATPTQASRLPASKQGPARAARAPRPVHQGPAAHAAHAAHAARAGL
jgi:hypothetical protein